MDEDWLISSRIGSHWNMSEFHFRCTRSTPSHGAAAPLLVGHACNRSSLLDPQQPDRIEPCLVLKEEAAGVEILMSMSGN